MIKTRLLNITTVVLGLVLSVSILLPSVVKFSHAFNHHKHDVCEGDYALHFHELDLDCEFYKFKLNNNQEFSFYDITIFSEENFNTPSLEHKSFLNNKFQLHRFQRGPPNVIA